MDRAELIKLKPEIKQRWLNALRSNNYKQGQGQLRQNDSYCCLGVLCDVVKDDLDIYVHSEANEFTGDIHYFFNHEEELLPNHLLEDCCEKIPDGINHGNIRVYYNDMLKGLSDLNDTECLSFTEIADLIEAQL
jgi:hypothetical protein